MRKATDQRDAQTISLLWTCLLLFHGGDVTCFDACHVIWCGGHVIWCDVIACVVSCHVMQCDVMWCTLMWCALQWSRCVLEVVLWQCGDPKYYSVLQSTTPVLLCTAKYYSSTTLYYTVLQRTTPVLLCTTKYYSSTTLYCKVLLQYYSVLQSTTPVLLCTTKYYSSTTLYYTVLQRTTPVLLCTTKYYSSTTLYCKVLFQYYSVLQSTTPVLLCTTQYYNVLLQYYSVLLQYYSVLQSTTPVLLCTTKYYSSTLYYTVLQRTTPVLLCTTKQHSWLILDTYEPLFTWLMSVAYETSFTMRGVTGVILRLHQILHLPRKMTVMIDLRHIWNVIYNARSNRNHNPTSPNTAPATQNESHDWSASHMKRHLQCAEQPESPSNLTKYCACHAKWISWNVIYNARSNKHHTTSSPNTAPATQNESHD